MEHQWKYFSHRGHNTSHPLLINQGDESLRGLDFFFDDTRNVLLEETGRHCKAAGYKNTSCATSRMSQHLSTHDKKKIEPRPK